ncbi:MAG: CoA ester lyase [Pseudomonadota bacterium]
MTDYRSWLFVPADSPRKIEKGLSSEADCVILDLEDSVATSEKDNARSLLSELSSAIDDAALAVFVRVNALNDPDHTADLETTLSLPVDGIMLPKAASGADVSALANSIEQSQPTSPLSIAVIATETPGALFNLGTYAGVSDRLTAITWGAEDLSAEVGAERKRFETGEYTDLFRLARSLCLAGAAHANAQALDTVFTDIRDEEGLRAECEAARQDGFTGKMAIHPAQVPVINAVFTPSAEAIDWANRVVNAFETNANTGVLSLDGTMIDRPHLKKAHSILARARQR